MSLLIKSDALLSTCGLYRYWLSRTWGDTPPLVVIGLNPSTADAMQDDPTIRRCIGFARREGCGGLMMLNLFAFRATDPAMLYTTQARVGPLNDYMLHRLATGKVLAAWGAQSRCRRSWKPRYSASGPRRTAAPATRSMCGQMSHFCLGVRYEH